MEKMKHIFVVNPTAGTGVDASVIEAMLKKLNTVEYEIYTTKYKGDTARFVTERAKQGDRVRFYACGGDGTMKDVAEGLIGYENASMTVYPVGSGNDFVRCFGDKAEFLNLAKLTAAEEITVDAIKVNDQICLNACHFGFDSAVASTMIRAKPKKLIGGKNAYTTGVVKALLCNMKNNARIIVDGEEICSDAFLLCSLCNGGYVGGGYHCAPRSVQDDGKLEVCLVKPISRTLFIKLMDTYRAGGHLDDPRFKDVVIYRRCEEAEIHAGPGFAVSLDGEILEAQDLKVSVLPGAIRFAVPQEQKRELGASLFT